MFEKKKKPEDMVKISPDKARQILIEKGYMSKNYPVLINSWIQKYSLLSTKLVGRRVIYKERLLELIETGDIKE